MAKPWTSLLNYPIPPACNPHILKLADLGKQWVLNFNLVNGCRGLERYLSYDLHKCVAYAHPKASPFIVSLILDATTWFILSDDHYDEKPLGSNPKAMKRQMDRFKHIALTLTTDRYCSNIELAIHDICVRAAKYGSEFYNRFRFSLNTYWDACLKEVKFRSSGIIPDKVDYMSVRSTSVGMNCLFDLIVIELDIPPTILDDSCITIAREIASILIAKVNDLDSYDKENAHGDTNNLCCVLMKENNISIEEARIMIVNLHNNLMNKFLDVTEKLAFKNRDCMLYGEALRQWVRAVYDWQQVSNRYVFLDNADVVLYR